MEIPDKLVSEIHGYLIKRPYGEVEGICIELRVLMARQNSQTIHENHAEAQTVLQKKTAANKTGGKK
jgi:hypothetical protein